MQDSIEREIIIAAPPERVWAVITTPKHLNSWLWDFAEIDLQVGGALRLGGTREGESFTYEATIEHLDPPRVFAFRWAEGGWVEGGATRVEFVLSAEGDGTRLRLVESGFMGLSVDEDRRRWLFGVINGGWQEELSELAAYVEGAAS